MSHALLLLMFLISFISGSSLFKNISWDRGPDLPLPRNGYYAAWYNDGLLIAGGTYWKNGRKYWTEEVSFYDPAIDTWVKWEPLPRPLAYGGMAQIDGA